jgi:fermentation-respiration switch protein FrsA (DUF1100 family)
MLIAASGCNVFMLEYRGYGISTGQPDESGLNIDAQTALDYLRDRVETRDHKIVVYGQSLGGAVGIRLVAKNQGSADISGLILENTFLSMRKLIPSIMPPAKYLAYLCHQVWPSDTLMPSIKVPTLFLSGLQDELIPYVVRLLLALVYIQANTCVIQPGPHEAPPRPIECPHQDLETPPWRRSQLECGRGRLLRSHCRFYEQDSGGGQREAMS